MNWSRLAEKAMGSGIDRDEALTVLYAPETETLPLLQAAYQVRKKHFGNKVKCCMLINAQSGACSEDCAYCSQSKVSKALIEKYKLVDTQTMVDGGEKFRKNRTKNYSIVTSGRGPNDRMIERVCEAVRELKAKDPELEVCASLGILKQGQAQRLKEAGLDRYHHNINTSRQHHDQIVTTHSFEDRIGTVNEVIKAGLSSCCGVIVGMGEAGEEVVDMAFTLRELTVDSIPVNFLAPVEGTPMEEQNDLTPLYCLRVLAMFRLVCPEQELRLAGGREINLRSLQPLALYAASSLFVGDYLTLEGNSVDFDHQMVADMGFEIDFEA